MVNVANLMKVRAWRGFLSLHGRASQYCMVKECHRVNRSGTPGGCYVSMACNGFCLVVGLVLMSHISLNQLNYWYKVH